MKIRSPLIIKPAAWIVVTFLKAIFGSLKNHFHVAEGTNPYDPDTTEKFLYCIWHDEFLVPSFAGKSKVAALVSRHSDGSFLSSAFECVDIKPVRGSTSRGGAEAIRQLLDSVDDRHICITPDGPRGPRHELKQGIIYIASKSGRRIVPSAYVSEREWRIKGNWTDQMIPKPFSNLHLFTGEPIAVPPDLSREDIDHYMELVQKEMDRLNELCQRTIRGEVIEEKIELKRAA
ncbi:MAG: hypothetical protein CMJ78_05325 [Planctomycetaceae bacterium]|nr:hypothetical protein [Planctomycetaceae bacterium]